MNVFALIVLVVNVLWFGMAFRLFALQPRKAIKLLTPKSAAAEASREALVAGLRFLGGMNLGFASLSAAQLAVTFISGAPPSWPVFFGCAIAHASQFACNVPFALRGGRGAGAPWDVLRGPMAFIFVVDALAALANASMLAM